ncbi:AEC family transporter [Jeotgalicoccus nanhaiensis]|uniref:AEC family transporter n=1 Tax=Jeotgalicoccus nanhaiensis TaxID=568603 RepID=A0ABR9XWZ6_9STAP|nr:AEC family transporter [Jeotgalicoccus nanhaiensis]MBF0753484.1 AEC family transporter [Jeotgalicoccus nanhaiensis]TFU62640.1 AEC family transporter [Jeotgalicoccus nanhaiensis]
MNVWEIIVMTFTDMGFLSAIASTILIILLGFFCRKRGIFNENVGKILSKIVLTVALPALAFTAFMTDIDSEQLAQGINVLIWGILMYIVLMFAMKPLYLKYKGDEKTTLEVLSIFGSTTFFGIPIVSAILGPVGVIYANIFNIGYRIFLYSYAYIRMSGLKMELKNLKSMFLNPIVIATFLGLAIWLFQEFLPQVTVAATETEAAREVAILRIDQTLPWLYAPMEYLSKLASPLAWLAIGATLAEINIGQAAKSTSSWYYAGVKTIIVPAINLAVFFLTTATGILVFDIDAVTTMIVMMATPAATVAVAYAINFEREAILASNASLLSTLAAVILIPTWLVILNIIGNLGIF